VYYLSQPRNSVYLYVCRIVTGLIINIFAKSHIGYHFGTNDKQNLTVCLKYDSLFIYVPVLWKFQSVRASLKWSISEKQNIVEIPTDYS